jgi:hypothetical protein
MTSHPIILSELLTASLNKQLNIKTGGREMDSFGLAGDQLIFEIVGLGGVGRWAAPTLSLSTLEIYIYTQEPTLHVTVCLQHK